MDGSSTDVAFVFCTECGNKLKTTAKFCDECGTKIFINSEQPDNVPDEDPVQPPLHTAVQNINLEDEVMNNGSGLLDIVQDNHAHSKDTSGGENDNFNPFQSVPPVQYDSETETDNLLNPSTSIDQQVVEKQQRKENEEYLVRFKPGQCGIEVERDTSGAQLIVSVLPSTTYYDGEEENYKICLGDVVLEVNGENCATLTSEEFDDKMSEITQSNYKIKFRSTDHRVDNNALFGEAAEAMEGFAMIHRTKGILYEPPDHLNMIYGYIERFRGDKMITFHLYRESDKKFILAASMEAKGHGKIVFHNMQDVRYEGTVNELPQHSHSAAFLGSMTQNTLGTEFVLRDYNVSNPYEKAKPGRIHELGLVKYETNIMGRVPNSLKAILPRYDPISSLKGQRETLHNRLAKLSKRRRDVDKTLLQAIKSKNEKEYKAVEQEEMEDLLTFDTKKPSWNPDLGAWTLNFNGRVKVASKKNFLMVPDPTSEAMDEEYGSETVCLRFGKVLKDRFSLDYRHPISPIQAMAICLTSFAKKLAVT